MKITQMAIEGAWIAHSKVFADERGFFREWFKDDEITALVGRSFDVSQANISSSNSGVIRGIHYSLTPGGQAKWITCVSGSIWDVIVDIRPSSPTFGKWVSATLEAGDGNSVFISEGLGHGFVSLEDRTLVSYLQTAPYSPTEEYEIDPFDESLAITWPQMAWELSTKDASAPSLMSRFREGKLPR